MCHALPRFDPDLGRGGGQGVVYSWERVWHPVHPALKGQGLYLVSAPVELPHAGDVRMVGNLLGDPRRDPVIGEAVEVVFEHHETADPPFTLAQWRPVNP